MILMSFNSWIGTNKHPSQENAESSQQALNPEHHPRAELSTSNDQDLAPERQRTTGALGEIILVILLLFLFLL